MVISKLNVRLIKSALNKFTQYLDDEDVQQRLVDDGIEFHLRDQQAGPIFIVQVSLKLHEETQRWLENALKP